MKPRASLLLALLLSALSLNSANQPAMPTQSKIEIQEPFCLNESGYFSKNGVSLMAFQDLAEDSHQGGIILIQETNRTASNGNLRLEASPGQWSPTAKMLSREVDSEKQEIRVRLAFPDPDKHHRGFNPLHYPDLELAYQVRIRASGPSILVDVDLNQPLPEAWAGEVGFLIELFPNDLFGQPWLMDGQGGIFPRFPSGARLRPTAKVPVQLAENESMQRLLPLHHHQGEAIALATGRKFTLGADGQRSPLQIESQNGPLELLDGRVTHANGWFILRSPIPAGAMKNAVSWRITPQCSPEWRYPTTIQHSQVGYHPAQEKRAVIECDPRMKSAPLIRLLRLNHDGEPSVIKEGPAIEWGPYLRYRYFQFDFSDCREPGMYVLESSEGRSTAFAIAGDVYHRNVWQPTLDYFLPIQMGHMRVKEKYRLWHDDSHRDDARMAPINTLHFDGYAQGPSTLTPFESGAHVPGLNQGGWYDAGDEDFRIESQAGEVFVLSTLHEAFAIDRDNTRIDQQRRQVELREPDGNPDLLQQIEHGLLSIVGAYESLGRLYRGIIVPTLDQYVMGGDFSGQTDNEIYDPSKGKTADDRWVFTEENPAREFHAIADLAASVPAMRSYHEALAQRTLACIHGLWEFPRSVGSDAVRFARLRALVECFRIEPNEAMRNQILAEKDWICAHFDDAGWIAARVVRQINDPGFEEALRACAQNYHQRIREERKQSPYGLALNLQLWGRAWHLQRLAFQHYFIQQAFPADDGDLFPQQVLHYLLGKHPGGPSRSYASGVGAKSKLAAYGFNRMDGACIPGGVVVGTALIAPDFPELKEFPFLWQQSEYVLGGGSTHFVHLALAVDAALNPP
jgi:hypothetical protein